MEWLLDLNHQINAVIWGPLMVGGIIIVGLYLTLVSGGAQFRYFPRMLGELAGRHPRPGGHEGDVSAFKAVASAMGGTVGVGNIVGVATAISLGGPGALLWMWVSGLVGMCTKMVEVILAVHYRERERRGPMLGGPMRYITEGMGRRWRWLAVLFAVFGALAAFGIGNMVQANSVAHGLEQFGLPRIASGLGLVALVGVVTIGGIRRLGEVAGIVVPGMIVLYLGGVAVVLAAHLPYVPAALRTVLTSAFTPIAAVGGFAGATVMQAMRFGIARGVFSNEAGLGSAPIVHAAAVTDHPVRQGLWGIFEVFVDTLVVATATGLAILVTGTWTLGDEGAALTMRAFDAVFPAGWGSAIVVLSLGFFAYSTILTWSFYGETCAAYLLGGRIRALYRLLWLPFVLVGALGELAPVWAIADTLNAFMAVPNLIALVALSGVAVRLLRDFRAGVPR
ncbi:MAG TPA: sodium:alanine symporter family protein [Clostridiales bacterium]|nr:sodium:alanine symporter family protein [Clostridiales bacterium]